MDVLVFLAPLIVGFTASAGFASFAFVHPVDTSRWDPEHPPRDWQATRQRWEQSQGIRTVPLLVGFHPDVPGDQPRLIDVTV
jgi:hypothetical protein